MTDVEETPGRPAWAIPALVATMVLALLTVGSVIGYQMWTGRADTGVEACEAMTHAKDKGDTPKPTADEWRKARDMFEKSRDVDIRSAGTDFVDRAQEISNAPEEDMMLMALTALPAMTDAFNRLDKACNKHGHDLPAFGDL